MLIHFVAFLHESWVQAIFQSMVARPRDTEVVWQRQSLIMRLIEGAD